MKKLIIFSIIVILCCGILIVGNIEDTTFRSGVLDENGITLSVDITITRTKFDKLVNKISRDMIVKGNNVNYQYKFSGHIFEMDNYYAAPVFRKGQSGLETQGYLYFDENMKNVAIETTKEKIYAAEEKFIENLIN